MDSLYTSKLNRRIFLQMTGGLTLAALVAGCVNPPTIATQASLPPNGPQRGGVLRLAFVDSVTSFEPILWSDADFSYGYTVFDTLVGRSDMQGASLLPQLAESWEMSDDALSYTFYLRKGVTFHHGSPFTAKDVAFTVERILDPARGKGIRPSFSAVERIEIVDDHTIVFYLNRPSVTLPFVLSSPSTQILPHDRTDEQLSTEPSGTGPFRLVEHIPGERTVFARNENYWEAGLPYLDELHFLEIPVIATQIASLTSGAVDVVTKLGVENLSVLAAAEGVQIVESTQGIYPYFVMNVMEKPFDDIRVRQAFKHAIDRTTMHQVILQGRGAVLNDQPVTPVSPLWADIPPLDYDVEKAKALLAEAGYADGLEVTLSIAEVLPRIVDTAVILQGMLKDAGITLSLNRVPVGGYWDEYYMQAPFFVSYRPSVSEPDNHLSAAFVAGSPFNESNWSDPRVDALIVESRGQRDLAVRKEQLAEIQRIISHEGADIVPYLMPFMSATRDNVRDFAPSQFILPQFIWMDQQG